MFPFNPDIFTEVDYIATNTNENVCIEEDENQDNQCRILVIFDENIDALAANEEVSTSISDVSSTSTASLRSALNEIGPVRGVQPKKKSNRGRKPMVSAISTSSEKRIELHEQAAKRSATIEKKKKKAPEKKKQKQKKRRSSSSSLDEDFCIICLNGMPNKLKPFNSIKCVICSRAVHLKCANIQGSSFTCINCDSEYSENEE